VGGRDELDFSRLGIEVGAVTEDGEVSWDFGGCSSTEGGEDAGCGDGDSGDAETNCFG
jgi:hypothetical protein